VRRDQLGVLAQSCAASMVIVDGWADRSFGAGGCQRGPSCLAFEFLRMVRAALAAAIVC
jgi:hypothetical protein